MKFFSKLALISSITVLSTAPVSANIYRIDFNYGLDQGAGATGSEFEGVQGSLDGFMVIDLSLDTGNQSQTDIAGFYLLSDANWITQISLTFDPDNNPATTNSVTKTRSDFRKVNWDLSGGSNSFNINNSFPTQFTEFGFTSVDGDNSFATGGLIQNYTALGAGNEFPLNSTTTTPGGLPFLGLGALALYYKKLKTKNFKL